MLDARRAVSNRYDFSVPLVLLAEAVHRLASVGDDGQALELLGDDLDGAPLPLDMAMNDEGGGTLDQLFKPGDEARRVMTLMTPFAQTTAQAYGVCFVRQRCARRQ